MIDFSLFYFASDEADYARVDGREKYKLLLEGARFADDHNFCAVWTPERHFHTFGGMFPSPAVAASALSMITKRIGIRAGSVVLPLHNPVRVAEEWSLVDNLSDGRVGISFASGWQPQDFAIAPDAYAARHQRMFDGIETVRALWRGETRQAMGGDGTAVTFCTRPRPVQRELPIWVTAGGTPETFRRAGEIGANILTHLLQQSIEQLRDRLAIYRQAWREAGHPGDGGKVTLMLHTFVADDDAYVRTVVHEPFKNYLKGAVGLFAAVAPKGVDVASLSAGDLDALAEHAFDRYFESSGLFGTPESCMPTVERLRQTGVTELACLIDFGIPAEAVIASLPWLNELRERWTTTTTWSTTHDASGEAFIIDDVIDTAAAFVPPGSPTERALAELWQTSLRVDAIGALDNFFDHGGHSLLAMQLANRIRDRFDVEITVKDVFHQPTLRDLAAHIDARTSTAAARAERVLAEHAMGFEYGEV